MDGSPLVVEALRERLRVDGAVSFEELMELALYHRDGGLYRRLVPSLGHGAHYTTCARLDPALGVAIARWLALGWRQALGSPRRWHVIEVGGGDGSLAQAVLDALPRSLRRSVVYHMVEISEPAQAAQRARLGRRVRWAPNVASALRLCRGEALLLSNELVDAFPAMALARRGDQWWEVWLELRGDRLVEALRPAAEWLDAPGAYSLAELKGVPEATRAEVHRTYRSWLDSWMPLHRRGWTLTIDYGDEVEALYGRGGGGTLRGYFANFRIEERDELYRRIGLQDLTCDVNFTDLGRWGERHGWTTEALLTQRELLERFDVDLTSEAGSSALEFIARTGGAGTAFRALWQTRVGFLS